MSTERIARAVWAQTSTVAAECGPDAWLPQLTEVVDGTIVGDSWHGREWPTGTAQGFLDDYHAHARATHLVLTATGHALWEETGEREPIRTVVVVARDGEAFGLVAQLLQPDAEPFAVPSIDGDLWAGMVLALQPDNEHRAVLEQLADGAS